MIRASIRSLVFLSIAASLAAQTPVPGRSFTGVLQNESFGVSLAAVGDVNLDGRIDYAAGGNNAQVTTPSQGVIRVFDGFSGSILYTLIGAANGSQLGKCVGGAGDVDNDGYDDVVGGAPLFLPPLPFGGPNPPAAAFVYSGQTGAVIRNYYGSTSDRFGGSCTGIGDVNFDGFDDVAVGCDINGGNYVRVFSGAAAAPALPSNPTPPPTVGLYTLTGVVGDNFGQFIAKVGDLNGDGAPEFLVSAPKYDGPAGVDAGAAWLYDGQTGAQILRFDGPLAADNFGYAIAGLDDVDGDGLPDFAIGGYLADAPGLTDCGRVRVFSGATLQALYDVVGTSGAEGCGQPASAGDIDNDGLADLVVGHFLYDASAAVTNVGRVTVHRGFDGFQLGQVDGGAIQDLFGISLASTGDLDGDGCAEIAIGARGFDNGALTSAGNVSVYTLGPALGVCATSKVGGLAAENVLTINGSSGGVLRRVDVPTNAPITLSIAAPTGQATAPFLVWGYLGVPGAGELVTLPFGLGNACFAPPLLVPGHPLLFLVANSFVPTDPTALVQTAGPASYSIGSPGLGFSARFAFEGVILNGASLEKTNAVLLSVN